MSTDQRHNGDATQADASLCDQSSSSSDTWGRISCLKLFFIASAIVSICCFFFLKYVEHTAKKNESSAIGSCKTIASAQCDYSGNACSHTYSDTLKKLSTGEGAGGVSLMNSALGDGLKDGYTFHLAVGAYKGASIYGHAYSAWSAAAWPVSYKSTGYRSFYIDESGVVRGQEIGGRMGRIEMPSLY